MAGVVGGWGAVRAAGALDKTPRRLGKDASGRLVRNRARRRVEAAAALRWGGMRREQVPGALLVAIFAGMPLGAAFREDRFGRKARHARRCERRLSSPAA
jgi:hypothetical protein